MERQRFIRDPGYEARQRERHTGAKILLLAHERPAHQGVKYLLLSVGSELKIADFLDGPGFLPRRPSTRNRIFPDVVAPSNGRRASDPVAMWRRGGGHRVSVRSGSMCSRNDRRGTRHRERRSLARRTYGQREIRIPEGAQTTSSTRSPRQRHCRLRLSGSRARNRLIPYVRLARCSVSGASRSEAALKLHRRGGRRPGVLTCSPGRASRSSRPSTPEWRSSCSPTSAARSPAACGGRTGRFINWRADCSR